MLLLAEASARGGVTTGVCIICCCWPAHAFMYAYMAAWRAKGSMATGADVAEAGGIIWEWRKEGRGGMADIVTLPPERETMAPDAAMALGAAELSIRDLLWALGWSPLEPPAARFLAAFFLLLFSFCFCFCSSRSC